MAILDEVSAAVSAALGAVITVTAFGPTDGANSATHFRLTCADGRHIGLKVATRLADGTRREFLTAWTARTLGFPGALRCGRLTVPKGFASIGEREAVAIEWVPGSDKLSAVGVPTPARSSVNTARQVGQWVWLAIGLGVDDRHTGNWIWSEQQQIFSMIDFEDWRTGSQTGASLKNIVEQTIGSPVNKGQAESVLEGTLAASSAFALRRAEIAAAFTAAGEALPASLDGIDCLSVARDATGFMALALPAPPAEARADVAPLPPPP